MLPVSCLIACVLFLLSCTTGKSAAKLTWAKTKFLVVFGDSYTTDGYNISAGVDSPVPNFTSSNGKNWVQFLGDTYNVTDTNVFDLASGGATIDSALVPPYLPTVLSVVDQVTQFRNILAARPSGAKWNSSNTLFAFWIGINDVGNSFGWSNVTQSQFYSTLIERYSTQLDDLHKHGARSFLFLTVPPTDRAPLFLQQGRAVSSRMASLIASYNRQLTTMVRGFQARHRDLDQVTVFDTQPIFNALLDNAKTFGFLNATGFCEAYQNGTPEVTTQIPPCGPVSSYFWLNSLHPLFTVHNIIAHAISTTLSI
ncbi:hypothetical protein HGRIS_012698 [Hohenbuehelia grisea]|uniref:Carbohydrate esterase family 16 protein n=1 Tax=Hohenbuehelia grisea TaxID=104357 RepID=A0ABR3ITE2_9AGAR